MMSGGVRDIEGRGRGRERWREWLRKGGGRGVRERGERRGRGIGREG
jgi:hypothetical protein